MYHSIVSTNNAKMKSYETFFFYGTFIVLDPKHIMSEHNVLVTFESAV